jgi:hypothetical protein
MLLSCTCRISGFVQIIPVNKKDTTEKMVARFFNNWVAIFGSLKSIIGEQDVDLEVLEGADEEDLHQSPIIIRLPSTGQR